MANYVLFQWGPIQFQVYPFNVNQYSHATGADWAKKEIAGAAMYREWVGENDEMITLKGRIFPHYFARAINQRRSSGTRGDPGLPEGIGGVQSAGLSAGGLMHLDVLDSMRRLGEAHILIRGDGWHFGWFIVEELNRGHSLIAKDGIGQMIEFDAKFQRVPIPNDPATNTQSLWSRA